ncbi:hypothetical protein ACJX0J_011373, partial [Zea mays]
MYGSHTGHIPTCIPSCVQYARTTATELINQASRNTHAMTVVVFGVGVSFGHLLFFFFFTFCECMI